MQVNSGNNCNVYSLPLDGSIVTWWNIEHLHTDINYNTDAIMTKQRNLHYEYSSVHALHYLSIILWWCWRRLLRRLSVKTHSALLAWILAFPILFLNCVIYLFMIVYLSSCKSVQSICLPVWPVICFSLCLIDSFLKCGSSTEYLQNMNLFGLTVF